MAAEVGKSGVVAYVEGLGRGLRNRGLALEALSIGTAVFGLLVGVIVADGQAHDATGAVTHPHVALGVAIGVAALIVWALVWTIAQVVNQLGDYVAISRGSRSRRVERICGLARPR
jgi:hypothetical protein